MMCALVPYCLAIGVIPHDVDRTANVTSSVEDLEMLIRRPEATKTTSSFTVLLTTRFCMCPRQDRRANAIGRNAKTYVRDRPGLETQQRSSCVALLTEPIIDLQTPNSTTIALFHCDE